MTEPFIGEIRLFAGRYAPLDWCVCDGRLLPINGYHLLYQLLQTTYGGDGVSTFGIPDLRGRVPVGVGPLASAAGNTTYTLAQQGGAETVTLTQATMPSHTHAMQAVKTAATQASPGKGMYAEPPAGFTSYTTCTQGGRTLQLASGSIQPTGGGQAHDNVMPSMPLTYIIATTGLYPSPASVS